MKRIFFLFSLMITFYSVSHNEKKLLSNEVTPFSKQEEIAWWAPQMSEHALFLNLGLNEAKVPQLKKEGARLHKKLQYFTDNFKHADAYTLTRYKQLLHELRNYKVRALKATLNEWVGDLYPSLIKHMISELDYHAENLRGKKRSIFDELTFWNKHSDDVALVALHLLDPSEKQLIKQAQDLSDSLEAVEAKHEELESFKKISLNASKELDAYGKKLKTGITNHSVQSIINPVLLDHEARENAYAMKKLFGIDPKKENLSLS